MPRAPRTTTKQPTGNGAKEAAARKVADHATEHGGQTEEEPKMDFLDQKLAEIRERLAELEPLVTEYTRLEAAEKIMAEGVPNRGGRPRRS
jgi:hypothetical protein